MLSSDFKAKHLIGFLSIMAATVAASPTINLRQVRPNCGGSTTLQASSVVSFASLGYPSPYPNGLRCLWIASSPANTVIKMRCQHFNVTPSQRCYWDAFYFSPSGDSTLQNANYYCGSGVLETVTSSNSFAAGFFTHTYMYTQNYYPGFYCVLTVTDSDGDTDKHTPNPNPTDAPKPVTDPPAASDCNCGIKGSSRIVGGQETGVNEWPMQAGIRLQRTGDIHCAGVLINDRWIVTAGHCMIFEKEDIYVSLGDHNKYQTSETTHERHFTVDTIIVHERYDENTVDNDIALLRLSANVTINDAIRPVCLPFRYKDMNLSGKSGTVLGWGETQFHGETSGNLKEVTIPILTTEECRGYSIISSSITDNMICTYREGSDACRGDSGGPLLTEIGGRQYLMGLVSFGKGCADKDSPGVYTKVTNYVDWIQRHVTSGSRLCSPA